MNEAQAVAAVQQQIKDWTPTTKDRIEANLPMGLSIFAAEYEWEFLSVYGTADTKVGTTTGKTYIDTPADMFKPIVVWTDQHPEVPYINRKDWAAHQVPSSNATEPSEYTVIGTKMYLTKPNVGSTIYLVYTKIADDLSFNTVPAQYHPTIVMAISMWMVPITLQDGQGNELPNPLFDSTERRYNKFVQKAVGMDMSHKGRPRKQEPNDMMKLRNRHSR
jgi:hypothetical protein